MLANLRRLPGVKACSKKCSVFIVCDWFDFFYLFFFFASDHEITTTRGKVCLKDVVTNVAPGLRWVKCYSIGVIQDRNPQTPAKTVHVTRLIFKLCPVCQEGARWKASNDSVPVYTVWSFSTFFNFRPQVCATLTKYFASHKAGPWRRRAGGGLILLHHNRPVHSYPKNSVKILNLL